MTTSEEIKRWREIGGRVALLRGKRGMTQAILADKVRMSRQSLIMVEGGRSRTTLDKLVAIADALQVPAHWWLLPKEMFDFGVSLLDNASDLG